MRTAITLLQQMSLRLGPNDDTLDNLQQLSNHALHYLRWAAIQTLFTLDRAKGTQALLQALNDSHPHVRNAAQRSWNKLQALEASSPAVNAASDQR
jgi:HEAT repeat protein